MALNKVTYVDDVTVIHAQNLNEIQDTIGDGTLTGFTATDLTGAANELKDTLNNAVLQSAAFAITANGTASHSLTGLTADHVVVNWGMFSDSGLTTPIPENAPTCDIQITTTSGSWSVTIANFSSSFYLRPTFGLKQN